MSERTVHPIKRIIVGVDFSDHARAALDWAIRIARASNAGMTLVHAVDREPSDLPSDVEGEIRRGTEAMCDLVGQEGAVAAASVHWGRPWEVVVEEAVMAAADLIVIGAHGGTLFPSSLLGTTADRILRTAPMPVLTVHPQPEVSKTPVRSIVVGTDFSPASSEAVAAALSILLPAGEDAELTLVHAWQPIVEYAPMVGPIPAIPDVFEDDGRVLLDEQAASIDGGPCSVTSVLAQGPAPTILIEEASRRAADLIVVGSHGRRGLDRLLLGSVAERTVHHAACPVLTVRDPEAASRS